MTPERLLILGTVLAAAASAAVLLWYLLKRPPFVRGTMAWLFLGLGVFPIAAAVGGNVQGFETSKTTEFCASCHVMAPWIADANADVKAEGASLAAFHSRNDLFGDESCYACHADYGMYGTVLTKLEGTKHLRLYFSKWRNASVEQAVDKIELYHPFRNETCLHCHSTELPGWNDEPEHGAVAEEVRSGATSCVSAGCHGPAHGVKPAKETK